MKVTKADTNSYEITNQDGEVFDILKEDVECNHRLWTIEDAKDGDVLATSAGAFIYNGNNGGGSCPGSYCGINTLGDFQIGIESHWTGKNVYPATKEQRDLLFAKMKEAGYEFDGDKKELKRIEQKPLDNVEPKFKAGDWVVNTVGDTNQVVKVWEDGYTLDNDTFLSNSWATEHYHRWTIQDAEDGHVLVSNGKRGQEVGIVKKFIGKYGGYDKCFETYCYSDLDGTFRIGEYMGGTSIHPATKEQRDLLFQKMADAGYKWDAGKKELWHKL